MVCNPDYAEPYSDDDMCYDETAKHYILTEKALKERVGVDLRARLARGSTVAPEVVIDNFNRTVSDMVYECIHEFNINNAKQDYLIAHSVFMRRIIFEAMKYQAVYVAAVGNLYLSTKVEERENAIDRLAKSKLATVNPYWGKSILYGGRI